MSTLAELDAAANRYALAMNEIKYRLAATDTLYALTHSMNKEAQPSEWLFTWEQIALHLRKVVELIVFGNMVAHQEKYREIYPDLASHWKIGKILKKLESIHPEFFPVATKIGTTGAGQHHAALSDEPKASREDLEVLYDKCSDLIHAFQPFKHGDGGVTVDLKFTPKQWTSLIWGLLREHFIVLVGNEQALLVQMTAPPNGMVSVKTLQAQGPATSTPADIATTQGGLNG